MTFFITPFHYTDCFSVRQIGYGGTGPILSDEEQIPRAELRAALDYLQESGYIAARTVKDHTPAHVSDLPLEDMECKLMPAGVQLLGGHIKDPLVRP